MTRQEANKLILKKLSLVIKSNPDIRFCQLLRNLGAVREIKYPMINQPVWANEFNTESTATLENMEKVENDQRN